MIQPAVLPRKTRLQRQMAHGWHHRAKTNHRARFGRCYWWSSASSASRQVTPRARQHSHCLIDLPSPFRARRCAAHHRRHLDNEDHFLIETSNIRQWHVLLPRVASLACLLAIRTVEQRDHCRLSPESKPALSRQHYARRLIYETDGTTAARGDPVAMGRTGKLERTIWSRPAVKPLIPCVWNLANVLAGDLCWIVLVRSDSDGIAATGFRRIDGAPRRGIWYGRAMSGR